MKNLTNKEWEIIQEQNPSSDDFRYLIGYTDKKDEAAEKLLKQGPSNDDLRYLIEYTDKKDEAQKILDERMKNKRMIDIIKER